MKVAIAIVVAFVVGVAAGGAGGEEAKPVVKEAAPVAGAPLEVTPQACLDAITEARANFDQASEVIAVLSEGMVTAGAMVQAASSGDNVTLAALTAEIETATGELNRLNGRLSVEEFNEAATACESS